MLTSQRQNVHYSKLPKPGAIGHIVGLSSVNPHRKCIVVAFPLTDSPDYRYSLGIHTCWVKFLDNGDVHRFSSIWFQESE